MIYTIGAKIAAKTNERLVKNMALMASQININGTTTNPDTIFSRFLKTMLTT